jgi:hypothetical protein
MKKLLTIISAAVALAAFAPTKAKADCSRRFVGYDDCGNAVYAVSYFAGYDCYGYPVYRLRNETVCRAVPRCYDSYNAGYNCRPYSRPYCGSGYGAGVTIHSPGIHLSVGHGRCH